MIWTGYASESENILAVFPETWIVFNMQVPTLPIGNSPTFRTTIRLCA